MCNPGVSRWACRAIPVIPRHSARSPARWSSLSTPARRSNLSWDDSIRLDLYYVENWSLTTDILILWRTVRAVVTPEGAH